MRWTAVPPVPASVSALADLRAALPERPDARNDCCAIVLRADAAVDAPNRERAADWLVFLRALGLAREADGTYARTDAPVARESLGEAFVANVYGAREVLNALGDGAHDTDEVTSRVPARVGEEERVRRLLGWAVLFGLAETRGDGYVRT